MRGIADPKFDPIDSDEAELVLDGRKTIVRKDRVVYEEYDNGKVVSTRMSVDEFHDGALVSSTPLD
jgi:hypothetical protein